MDVFIIGSKGIPAQYGGFETFVEKLTFHKKERNLQYHVACMGSSKKEYIYQNSRCFHINVPDIGPAKAVYYDLKAMQECLKYCKKKNLKGGKIYILACRIGPFLCYFKQKFGKYGFQIFVNPDGHEWARGKWNFFIKKYWKLSERLMVKHADLIICDSVTIEEYIQKEYLRYSPKTRYLSYGADENVIISESESEVVKAWYKEFELSPKNYYLIVGRFVPENNYETIIAEFIKSNTTKKLVIVTNVENNPFFENLKKNTCFEQDERIIFVGTVYNQSLLNRIRTDAFAYIHGHEVGGTNPSLLEALSTTKINLLLDVGFNREVAEDTALYWDKADGSLARQIDFAEGMMIERVDFLADTAKKRMKNYYNWKQVAAEYEKLFLG